MNELNNLRVSDPEMASVIDSELARQKDTIELIASENFTSKAVMEAQGSVLTNKYAEGYPAHRYYGGCEKVDMAENLAIERVCKLFNCNFANVQPHSGSQANFTTYMALIKPGDTVLGMSLDSGGHLTHGSPVNFSGILYNIVSYGVDERTGLIDYDELERIAKECKPKMIIGGASAYPRIIDFKRMAEIAHEVGAYLMVDMAHIAGLVATGAHPSPLPYADVVTSTTHKTLRGPRGGIILTNSEEIAKKINKMNFPGCQGGPLEHVIAAKAVAFGEALKPEFKTYIDNVITNCKAMVKGASDGGLDIVTGGTDNHLALLDLTRTEVTGKEAQELLERVHITANKNSIPGEERSPFVTSGIRVGSAACTTRGFTSDDFYKVGAAIAKAIYNSDDEGTLSNISAEMKAILKAHPLYE